MPADETYTVEDVKVGDVFVEVTPSGRERRYRVRRLDSRTPQGVIAPEAVAEDGDIVYLSTELLAQEPRCPLTPTRDE